MHIFRFAFLLGCRELHCHWIYLIANLSIYIPYVLFSTKIPSSISTKNLFLSLSKLFYLKLSVSKLWSSRNCHLLILYFSPYTYINRTARRRREGKKKASWKVSKGKTVNRFFCLFVICFKTKLVPQKKMTKTNAVTQDIVWSFWRNY